MIGTRILHYEIRKKLGEGGMGVVYLAFDTQLGRPVALKVLARDRVADADSRKRFLHEARAQAMLNHPNITTFYDVGEHGDTAFIVMEYVEGRPLSNYLCDHECRPLEVVRLGHQLALGLSAAHTHGVIHRDIKPENIMVMPNGHVKIMDFGLARWKGASTLTQKGMRLGSPCYMAPEQAEGAPVDHRADIFALGIVLYELLCRRRPFEGENEAVVLYELINATPQPPARYCRGIPDELERIVLKCLAKHPDARYQSAADLGADLKNLEHDLESGRLNTPSRRVLKYRRRARTQVLLAVSAVVLLTVSAVALLEPVRMGAARILGIDYQGDGQCVVVVPFTLLGGERENLALAAGILETVTSKLTQMESTKRSMHVIPASEVRRENVTSAHDARLAFGATHAVTGSMQALSDSLRVIVNLVDADREVQLSSVIIASDRGRMFGLQDSIAYSLATMLAIELDTGARGHLPTGQRPLPEAYGGYLEGLGYLELYMQQLGTSTQDPSRLDSAIARFVLALRRDSAYAACHADLGRAYWAKHQLRSDEHLQDSAIAHALRAVELDPQLSAAWMSLAHMHQRLGRYLEALSEFRHALQIDSLSIECYLGQAEVYTELNRLAEAEAAYRRALAQGPDYLSGYAALAMFYADHGRMKDALALMDQVSALRIEGYANWNRVGAMHFSLGDTVQARRSWERSMEIHPNYLAASNLGTVHYYAGEFDLAARNYETCLAMDSGDYRIWANLASACEQIPERVPSVKPAYRRAIALAEEERAVNPRQPSLLAQMAEWYQSVGDTAGALALAREALALAPDRLDVIVRAGLVHEKAGMRDTALVLIGRALALGFSRPLLEGLPELAALLSDPQLDEKSLRSPTQTGGKK